jgi:hypothetical protein
VRRSTIPNSEIAPAGKHRRGQVTRAGTLSTLPPDLGCWSDNTTYTLIPEAEARGTETQRLARAVCAACTAQQQNSKNKHPVKGGEPASHTHARAHSPCHPRSAKHSTTQPDKHRRARKWQRLPRARHAVRWPQEPCGPAHGSPHGDHTAQSRGHVTTWRASRRPRPPAAPPPRRTLPPARVGLPSKAREQVGA